MSVLGHRLRRYVKPENSLLLDTYPSATIAYSVRKLRTAYSGQCMRIKRSSDSTESDIGFDGAGYVDTAAISSFAGAGDCGAVTWYDQSGNGYNLTTTDRTVAKMVVGGVLQTHNSLATCKFANVGAMTHLAGASIWTAATACASAVASIGSASSDNGGRLFSVSVGSGIDYSSTTGILLSKNGATTFAYRDAFLGTQTITYDQLHVQQSNFTGTEHVMIVDGAASTPIAISTAFSVTQLNVGKASAGTEAYTGSMSELVAWPTDQTSNVAGIRTNQKNYFGTA